MSNISFAVLFEIVLFLTRAYNLYTSKVTVGRDVNATAHAVTAIPIAATATSTMAFVTVAISTLRSTPRSSLMPPCPKISLTSPKFWTSLILRRNGRTTLFLTGALQSLLFKSNGWNGHGNNRKHHRRNGHHRYRYTCRHNRYCGYYEVEADETSGDVVTSFLRK